MLILVGFHEPGNRLLIDNQFQIDAGCTFIAVEGDELNGLRHPDEVVKLIRYKYSVAIWIYYSVLQTRGKDKMYQLGRAYRYGLSLMASHQNSSIIQIQTNPCKNAQVKVNSKAINIILVTSVMYLGAHELAELSIKKIENYLFDPSQKIGEGSFSQVFKGCNLQTGQIVAIKQLRISEIKSKIARRLLECQISNIKDITHPNILQCRDVHFSANNCYIITEFCQGGDLDAQLQRRKRLPQPQIDQIVKDLVLGLQYLASKSIIHRDLKVSNILKKGNQFKIADFGFSIKADHLFKDISVGSPVYMSPQGLIHNLYGPKTDIWAFGLLVYELLHGSAPLSTCGTQQELNKKVLQPVVWTVNASQQLRQMVQGCLKVIEKERFGIQQLIQCQYIKQLLNKDLMVEQKQQKLAQSIKTVTSTETSISQQAINFLPQLSYESALSLIHYCRLIHKVCKIRPSLLLRSWLVLLSSALSNAKIDYTSISVEKQINLKQIISEYHLKYLKEHSIYTFEANITFSDIMDECSKLAKINGEGKDGVKGLSKETALLKKAYERGEIQIFAKKSKSQNYASNF